VCVYVYVCKYEKATPFLDLSVRAPFVGAWVWVFVRVCVSMCVCVYMCTGIYVCVCVMYMDVFESM